MLAGGATAVSSAIERRVVKCGPQCIQSAVGRAVDGLAHCTCCVRRRIADESHVILAHV